MDLEVWFLSVSVPLVVLSIIFTISGVRKAVLVKSWASLGMGQNSPLKWSISDNYKCSSRSTRPNWMKTYSLPQKNVAQLMVMVSGLKNVGVGNQKLFCVRCPCYRVYWHMTSWTYVPCTRKRLHTFLYLPVYDMNVVLSTDCLPVMFWSKNQKWILMSFYSKLITSLQALTLILEWFERRNDTV